MILAISRTACSWLAPVIDLSVHPPRLGHQLHEVLLLRAFDNRNLNLWSCRVLDEPLAFDVSGSLPWLWIDV